jgi:hypothetical protein
VNPLTGTKPSRFLLAITSLTLTLFFTFAVTTATAKHKGGPPAPPVDTRILIESVNAAGGEIVLHYMQTQGTQTYAVDGFTTITVNDVPGKIGQIKAGMQVRDLVERDGHTLDSLSVSKADPAPTAPAK